MSTIKPPSDTTAGANLYGQLNRAVDSIPTQPVHYKILGLVAIGGLFNAIEQYNVAYAGPTLARYFDLTNAQVGLLSTATFVSMALGSLLTGFLSDRYGRKPVFLANIALFAFGALIAAFAPSYGVLLLARILIGLGLGGEISLGFTVISEIMPTNKRGAMTAIVNFVTGGIGLFAASGLAALFFGPLSATLGGPDVVWRWWFGLMFLPALLLLFFRRYIPETPRYLLECGKIEETNHVLTLLEANQLRNNPPVATKDFIKGQEGLSPRGDGAKASFRDLFRPGMTSRTLVAWILAFATYGVSVAFIVFLPTILVGRGLDVASSLAYTTITTFAGVVGAAIGIFVSHRIPRKFALIIGGLASGVTASGFFLSSNLTLALSCAALTMCVLYIMFPIIAVYFTELFPTRIRGIGTGSTWFIGLLAAGLGSYAGGAIIDTIGSVGMFWAIAAMCLIIPIVAWFGPETSNLALDDESIAIPELA